MEFLTWDAHEAAIRKQSGGGIEGNIEEYEVSDDDFKSDLKGFKAKEGVKFDSEEWEEING